MSQFTAFARSIVDRNIDHLLDFDETEQVSLAVDRLERFHTNTPLMPVSGLVVNMAGFGRAPVHWRSSNDWYMLLSEVAEQVSLPLWDACEWARRQWLFDLEDQRIQDEQDGVLGYECMRDYLDLGVSFCDFDPLLPPTSHNPRQLSDYGEWLISRRALMPFLLDSPWKEEFMDNMRDVSDVSALRTWRDVFDPDLLAVGPAEQAALNKARRGPVVPG